MPINVGLTVANSSNPLITEKGQVTIGLKIQGNNVHSDLQASVSNRTTDFGSTFSQNSGTGNFSSELTITNTNAPAGVYYVTVSEITQNIVITGRGTRSDLNLT